ncbi:MAG TPA: hypothetical protein VJH97_05415 [Candidatus Nanoarchaeia archaeon]|nr:hypothetical protein [Candidatus Nanoarchaeia archaeon]
MDPCTWQGWIIVALCLLMVIGASYYHKEQLERGDSTSFIIFVLMAVMTIILIAYLKGEKPRWQWGTDAKK